MRYNSETREVVVSGPQAAALAALVACVRSDSPHDMMIALYSLALAKGNEARAVDLMTGDTETKSRVGGEALADLEDELRAVVKQWALQAQAEFRGPE